MNITRSAIFVIALALPGAASLLAAQSGVASQHASHGADARSPFIDKVRRATEPFRDVRNASPAGYDPILGCVSGPEEGAMGVHFLKGPLLVDGALDAEQPEALIYEFKGNVARLVGVEYIVLASAWHQTHAGPPVLEGQLLQFYDSPNRFGLDPFYELHVWAWRDNPNGAFVDWNPRVSCEGQ